MNFGYIFFSLIFFLCVFAKGMEDSQQQIIMRYVEQNQKKIKHLFDENEDMIKTGLKMYAFDRSAILVHELAHAASIADKVNFPPRVFLRKSSALQYKKPCIFISPVPFFGGGFCLPGKQMQDLILESRLPLFRWNCLYAAGPLVGLLYTGFMAHAFFNREEVSLGLVLGLHFGNNIINLLPIFKGSDGREIAEICLTRMKLGKKGFMSQLQEIKKNL